MKPFVIVLIAGAFVAAPAGAQEHHAHARKHQVAPGVKLEATTNAAAQVMTLRLGPMNLPAGSDHHAVAQPPDLFWTIPMDGWLVAYHPRLVDSAGQTVPGRLLHHVAFWNTRRADFLCPNKQEHIFGAGGEMNDWPGVAGYGYRVGKGERIRIETMVHNPTETDYPEVVLEVRVEYREFNATNPPLKSVYPTWFDVMECRNSGYDLPPGKSTTSGEITLRYSGILLGVGGHLHDYGQRVVLENLTRQEEVAALDSTQDAKGRLLSMPIQTFYDRGGYRLNRGDRVRVTATYDNPSSKLRPEGAMGIVVGYFLPENDVELAALRRRDK